MLRLLAVVCICAAPSACDRSGSEVATRAFVAAGVLAIDLPPATVASQRDGASAFTLDPGVRSPREIEVVRLTPGSAPSDLRWSESEGGSGGTEYELRGAVRRCGAVFAVMCGAQTEIGRPDMDWCTEAVASIRCRGQAR